MQNKRKKLSKQYSDRKKILSSIENKLVNISILENLNDFLVTLLLTYGKIFFPELDADCYEFCPALRPCGWRRHLSSGRFLFALSDNGYSAGKKPYRYLCSSIAKNIQRYSPIKNYPFE